MATQSIIRDIVPLAGLALAGFFLIKTASEAFGTAAGVGKTVVSDATEAIKAGAGEVYTDITGTPSVNLDTGEVTKKDYGFWKGFFARKEFTKDPVTGTPGPDVVHGGGTAYDAFLEHIGGYDDPGHRYDVSILPTPNPPASEPVGNLLDRIRSPDPTSSVHDYVTERNTGTGYTRQEGGREITFGGGGSSNISPGNLRNPGSKWKIS